MGCCDCPPVAKSGAYMCMYMHMYMCMYMYMSMCMHMLQTCGHVESSSALP